MAHHSKVDQKIREISGGSLTLNLKLLYVLSRRDVKYFKYTHNYPTSTHQPVITTILIITTKTIIAHKNNKRNRRRAAFYGINKFDYEVKENLTKRHLPLEETFTEKDKEVKSSPGNKWIEAWKPKITVIQTKSRKA